MCQVSGWPCSRGPRQPAVLNMGHIYTVAYLAPHEKEPMLSSPSLKPSTSGSYSIALQCLFHISVWEQAPAQGPGLA